MSNDSCAINTLLNDLREIGLNDNDEKYWSVSLKMQTPII